MLRGKFAGIWVLCPIVSYHEPAQECVHKNTYHMSIGFISLAAQPILAGAMYLYIP